MSFWNILAVWVCITQMPHQGAISAHCPAERELGYLPCESQIPKTATLGCSRRWSSGTHFPFFFVILYHTCATADLPKFQSLSLGVLLGSCRPVFIFLAQSSLQPLPPACVPAATTQLSSGSPRTWTGLDRIGCAHGSPFSLGLPLYPSIKVFPQLPSTIKMSRCHLGC